MKETLGENFGYILAATILVSNIIAAICVFLYIKCKDNE